MKPEDQKFVLHEGAIELEQMKLTMLKTVMRHGVAVLAVVFSVYVVLSFVEALFGTDLLVSLKAQAAEHPGWFRGR